MRGDGDLFLDHFRVRKKLKQIGLKSQPLGPWNYSAVTYRLNYQGSLPR